MIRPMGGINGIEQPAMIINRYETTLKKGSCDPRHAIYVFFAIFFIKPNLFNHSSILFNYNHDNCYLTVLYFQHHVWFV